MFAGKVCFSTSAMPDMHADVFSALCYASAALTFTACLLAAAVLFGKMKKHGPQCFALVAFVSTLAMVPPNTAAPPAPPPYSPRRAPPWKEK